ncbi:uncharacterized protein B0H18DRAFT_1005539 [Fomitopsis serialis]|uniref:uncharacterized protein n=1 Tax=Fomitopsis serialis TaxID=139415 RepID=UPI002008B651|nr:uncharacterized protein B0H18DRAFT_1005539 [Neoantrodia serialis]KAH9926782.1 hypothetical protein B0H18DRAFT_1005539 [Neoantrodia serialis]
MPDECRSPPGRLGPTTYNRLVGRYLRDDNKHIWLPLCVAGSFLAVSSLSPLVARRIPRFATSTFAQAKWSVKENVVGSLEDSALVGLLAYAAARQQQHTRAVQTDEAFRIITRAQVLIAHGYKYPVILSVFTRGARESTGSAGSCGAEEHVGFGERIGTAAATLWTSSITMELMRASLEDSLRRRNVSQCDIDRTTVAFGGAAELVKQSYFMWTGAFATFVVFVCQPLLFKPPLAMWSSAAWMGVSVVLLIHFQQLTLPMHIQNKRAVAAVLRERFPGLLEDDGPIRLADLR